MKLIFEKHVNMAAVIEEAGRVKSDIAFLNEACSRMKKSEHFQMVVSPRGYSSTTVSWFDGCWDEDFVIMYVGLRSIAGGINGQNIDDDGFMKGIATDLQSVRGCMGMGFDVVEALGEFIGCSWLAGKAREKIRELMS